MELSTKEKIRKYIFFIVPTTDDLTLSKKWLQKHLSIKAAVELLVWFIPVLMMLMAVLIRMPSEFYDWVRYIIFFCGVIALLRNYTSPKGQAYWYPAFIVIVCAYNPFMRFYLDRDVWTALNLITAVVFTLNYLNYKQTPKTVPQPEEAAKD